MLEQDLGLRTRETFISVSQPEFPTIPHAQRGTVYAFSTQTKAQVHEEQGERCAECGRRGCLQVHHKVPQSLGGSDGRPNAVGLCRGDHLYWDVSTLRDGRMYPGIPIEDAPSELIWNQNEYNKGVRQILKRQGR